MRYLLLGLGLLPGVALAQQPITLSPQEYQAVVASLAARDPVLRLLMTKQDAATEAASKGAKLEEKAK